MLSTFLFTEQMRSEMSKILWETVRDVQLKCFLVICNEILQLFQHTIPYGINWYFVVYFVKKRKLVLNHFIVRNWIMKNGSYQRVTEIRSAIKFVFCTTQTCTECSDSSIKIAEYVQCHTTNGFQTKALRTKQKLHDSHASQRLLPKKRVFRWRSVSIAHYQLFDSFRD